MARGLFIEPFYGGSHRAFADELVARSCHELVVLTLPGEDWRKRMRRGAQELALAAADIPGAFDFIVATDMLDLPAFLALTRPRFSAVPVMAYFHENQFTYPRIRGTKLNSWFGQINYLSAVAADTVAFNSAFHRDDLLGALATLGAQPNNWLLPRHLESIRAKSCVLPLGVDLDWLDGIPGDWPRPGPPTILWNHRWEFDKSPATFAAAIEHLAGEGLDFRLILAGDPGVNPHPALAQLASSLADRVDHVGFATSRDDYGSLLKRSDIVVSTTRHEFFGVGMVEALYCGCFPVTPANFTYPDLVPASLHDRCLYRDESGPLTLLRRAIAEAPAGEHRELVRASAARFAWPNVVGTWDEALARLASCSSATSASLSDRPGLC